MTAIEFFAETPIENLISCLAAVPDKIIFIGDGKSMRKWDGVYRRFLEKRGLSTELEYRSVNRHDLRSIVDALSAIVEQEESCVFDLTGGEDLALVAVGIVYERYRDKKPIQLQRLNLRTSVLMDCDQDGTLVQSAAPTISVEENILLHGGIIRYETEEHVGSYPWSLTPAFMQDVDTLWELCRENPGQWNTQLLALAAVDRVAHADEAAEEDPLRVDVYYATLENYLTRRGDTFASPSDLLHRLEVYGLITDLQERQGRVSFCYKDEQIRRCLTKAGTVLEMKVLLCALRAQDKDGSPFFHDAMNGVFIDWDGQLHADGEQGRDTENEVDAVLMRGLVPVFVSCKNGYVGESELYKLQSVAERFGGHYAKKALLATYMGKRDETSKEDLRQRARDMKIQLIEDLHTMSEAELIKTVRQLASS